MKRSLPSRRGAIATALVLAIVLLGVAVTAATVAAGSGLGLASLRVDHLRAVAACDAGLQLSLAELAAGLDTDGDGTIGGVSDNGIDADDPTLEGASFLVALEDGVLIAMASCGEITHTTYFELEETDPGAPEPAGAGPAAAKGKGKADAKSKKEKKSKKGKKPNGRRWRGRGG
ncbi:MAG: hypothetical protein IT433_08650 [Phycisphaerales bacterium]|nr:hypothetical protein [Phycisphaerales bacterium]